MERYIAFVLNNDACCVNPVETRFIASLQSQPQSASVQTQDVASLHANANAMHYRVSAVQTRCIASPPYFPPYLIHKTTSVARGASTLAQPYSLIYYMKVANKGIRLDVVCASMATEVVSLDIRSKIRYDVTTAGIPVQTRFIASLQPQSQFPYKRIFQSTIIITI